MEGRNEIERETRKWLEERKGEQKRAEVDSKQKKGGRDASKNGDLAGLEEDRSRAWCVVWNSKGEAQQETVSLWLAVEGYVCPWRDSSGSCVSGGNSGPVRTFWERRPN